MIRKEKYMIQQEWIAMSNNRQEQELVVHLVGSDLIHLVKLFGEHLLELIEDSHKVVNNKQALKIFLKSLKVSFLWVRISNKKQAVHNSNLVQQEEQREKMFL